jgi:hypothetical protein
MGGQQKIEYWVANNILKYVIGVKMSILFVSIIIHVTDILQFIWLDSPEMMLCQGRQNIMAGIYFVSMFRSKNRIQ